MVELNTKGDGSTGVEVTRSWQVQVSTAAEAEAAKLQGTVEDVELHR